MTQGRFISFEGGEGAGKSTQIARLAENLRRSGVDALVTREPGGSPGAEEIRALLVNGSANRWDGVTEALLNFAARRDHVEKTIRPALSAGRWVLSDRFADSTMAYQGYGHGLPLQTIRNLYALSIGDFSPDLTLVFDIDPKIGLGRALGRGGGEDRYEKMDPAFHLRLRQGFLDIAGENPDRCVVIRADQPADAVESSVWGAILNRFGSFGPQPLAGRIVPP